VREKSIKTPIEDPGGEERVDITDMETAKSWDVSSAPTKLSYEFASSKLFASELYAVSRGSNSHVLTAQSNAGLAIACYNDVVDEAGERGDAANEEGNNCAPVASVSGRVAVDTVKVVHIGYRYIAASNDVIAVARYK
jgi:hypothetical protein